MVEGLGVPLGVASPVNFKMLPFTVFAIFLAIVLIVKVAFGSPQNSKVLLELFEPLLIILEEVNVTSRFV
ncbi:Uncharacterised protein [Acinetobacter baumannii]|nr:Uncharacterised protein [Acinetobacter baumannii]